MLFDGFFNLEQEPISVRLQCCIYSFALEGFFKIGVGFDPWVVDPSDRVFCPFPKKSFFGAFGSDGIGICALVYKERVDGLGSSVIHDDLGGELVSYHGLALADAQDVNACSQLARFDRSEGLSAFDHREGDVLQK